MPTDPNVTRTIAVLETKLQAMEEELAELKAWKEKCGKAWLFLSAWWGGACMAATAVGGAVYYLYSLVHDNWDNFVSTITRIKP